MSIALVVTGKFVVSAFAMLLLVFMTDFAIALVANARRIRLCDALVPHRERCSEGRDDQVARSLSGVIDCWSVGARKEQRA